MSLIDINWYTLQGKQAWTGMRQKNQGASLQALQYQYFHTSREQLSKFKQKLIPRNP